jgi:hypothetical protein
VHSRFGTGPVGLVGLLKPAGFHRFFIDFRALKKFILPVFIDFHGLND